MMQSPKVRKSPSEVPPLKVSPRTRSARQHNPGLDIESPTSSNQSSRTPKERATESPSSSNQTSRTPIEKVTEAQTSSNQISRTQRERGSFVADRKSPKAPAKEVPKKFASKVSHQLESQVVQLQVDLNQAKEQVSLSESWKQQALLEAEEFREQISTLTSQLEDSKKKLLELSAVEEARSLEAQKKSEESEKAWQAKFEALQSHHSADFAALSTAMDEIQRLKSQLEMVNESAVSQAKHLEEASVSETHSLEEKLKETSSILEHMKEQLRESKKSEAHAQALASETLQQLETAKAAVEALRSEGTKSVEAYNALMLELEQSKAQINSLEELVSLLRAELSDKSIHTSQANDNEKHGNNEGELETLREQMRSMESELNFLRTVQESVIIDHQEEQVRSTVQLNNARELVEQVKSESSRRETDLDLEIQAAKSHVMELKGNLVDKETELQCIMEENLELSRKLESASSSQNAFKLEKELMELKEIVMDLKANLMDKETEFQNIMEENETLKSELNKKERDVGNANYVTQSELEAAKTSEREAVTKLEAVKEEADRNSKKAARVAEQLGAAQAANTEMETELRKIKVQSDQWRKAAEVAASMLSDGSPKSLTERNGSLEGKFSPLTNNSPYSEDLDDDGMKKRNGNVLKKFGLSWKKTQK